MWNIKNISSLNHQQVRMFRERFHIHSQHTRIRNWAFEASISYQAPKAISLILHGDVLNFLFCERLSELCFEVLHWSMKLFTSSFKDLRKKLAPSWNETAGTSFSPCLISRFWVSSIGKLPTLNAFFISLPQCLLSDLETRLNSIIVREIYFSQCLSFSLKFTCAPHLLKSPLRYLALKLFQTLSPSLSLALSAILLASSYLSQVNVLLWMIKNDCTYSGCWRISFHSSQRILRKFPIHQVTELLIL